MCMEFVVCLHSKLGWRLLKHHILSQSCHILCRRLKATRNTLPCDTLFVGNATCSNRFLLVIFFSLFLSPRKHIYSRLQNYDYYGLATGAIFDMFDCTSNVIAINFSLHTILRLWKYGMKHFYSSIEIIECKPLTKRPKIKINNGNVCLFLFYDHIRFHCCGGLVFRMSRYGMRRCARVHAKLIWIFVVVLNS